MTPGASLVLQAIASLDRLFMFIQVSKAAVCSGSSAEVVAPATLYGS
jgi:hypothetical protein